MDLFELAFLTLPMQVMHLGEPSSRIHSQVAHLALKSKRAVKHWHRLPREVGDAPSLETFGCSFEQAGLVEDAHGREVLD